MHDLAFSVPGDDAPIGEPRTNQFAGTCIQCGERVSPNGGYVFKTESGKWRTCCKSKLCYSTVFGAAAAASVGRRFVDEDGVIHGCNDAGSRSLLKAISNWDPDRRAPVALRNFGDRALVLEIAERLEIDVPESWRSESLPAPVAARVERARVNGARGYQLDGIAWLPQHRFACLADDMGLGKSFQLLHALPDDAACVIVGPAVTKGVWQLEIKKWCPGRFDSVHVCKGRGSFRWPKHARECVIINYDILSPEACEKKKHAPCGKPPCEVVIIADEAHALKNNKALRTKRFRAMARQPGVTHVWGATGTPVEAKPQELWGVLTSLRCMPFVYLDKKTGKEKPSWYDWLAAFSGFDGKYGLEFRRDSDGAIIVQPGTSERLRRTMLRRLKSEVAKELPPKIYSEHPVTISTKLIKELDEISSTWVDYLLDDELPPFEAMAAVRKLLADACTTEAEKLVAEYEEQATPLVVFSAHRAPIEKLGARKGWGMLIGGMSAEQRTQTIADFQAGRLLGIACTIRAAGVGVTLTRASSELFIDLDWSPSWNAQAEDRCHRLGQGADAVDIVRMVPDHVLTRHIASLLHAKQLFVDRTLHDVAEPDLSGSAGLTDEDTAAWRERVEAHQGAREKAESERRRRELSKLASHGKKLTAAQAEERAALRLRSRGGAVRDVPTDAVRDAFAFMMSVCDGAQAKDDQGFNAPDSAIARWAAPAVEAGSPAALTCAYTILRHYPRQLQARWGELFE